MSKIVQIACSQSQDSDNGVSSSLYALTDDGRVLELHQQEPASAKDAGAGTVGLWTGFWRPLPDLSVVMPVFVPTREGVTEQDIHPHAYVDRVERAAKARAAAKALAEKQAVTAPDVF
ncbi:hypothetical protein [Paraburkholderia sp. Cpub6]|uniref:hypothetical protein n=1 Tax=Paraburkholderia sp. Cpub6 TaxID=2723094 RepID=UPI00161CB61B|nr:hypothetical protein [Paraburkholderia sp. Cpub6]MBB5463789.1 hypothetical protein [Paraburkholderia sp. Cpub6]